MKINVVKSDFQKSILACVGISPLKGVNPVLSNILIETLGSDKIRLKATDTELGIIIDSPAQVEEGGQVLLHTKTLADVVRLLPDKNINFVSEEDSSRSKLVSGRSSFRFNCLPPSDFPRFPSLEEVKSVKVSSQTLCDAISKIIFAVPVDRIKNNVTGAHFFVDKKRVAITSTDNHRFVHCYFDLEGEENLAEINAVLPKKALQEIGKLLENLNEDVSLSFSRNKLFVTTEDTILICQVLDDTFPDILDAVPKENPNVLKVNRALLLAAIRRANIFSEDGLLSFNIMDEHTLRLQSLDNERGEASDEIEVEYSGEPLVIAFNAGYVSEVLNSMHEENIRIDIGTSLEPTIFRRCEDLTYFCIVMPIDIGVK